MNLPIIGCSGGDGYASKVLSLTNWDVVYDARFPGGTYTDTGLTTATRLDGDSIAAWRDWSGNGRPATQSTSGFRSTYQIDLSGSIDGMSTLGSDDTYTVSNSTGLQVANYLHGFIVLNTLGVAPAGNRFVIAGTATPSLQIRLPNATNNVGLAVTGTGVVLSASIANGVSLIEYRYFGTGTGSGSQYLRVNNNAASGPSAVVNTALTNPVAEIIGSFGGSFEGDFYCWYGWKGSAALDSSIVDAVRAQLGVEFGQAWS